jgi:hypothetical protein
LRFDLDIYFKIILRPKTCLKKANSLKTLYSRTVNATDEKKQFHNLEFSLSHPLCYGYFFLIIFIFFLWYWLHKSRSLDRPQRVFSY